MTFGWVFPIGQSAPHHCSGPSELHRNFLPSSPPTCLPSLRTLLLVVLVSFAIIADAFAFIRLPSALGSNMVLQRRTSSTLLGLVRSRRGNHYHGRMEPRCLQNHRNEQCEMERSPLLDSARLRDVDVLFCALPPSNFTDLQRLRWIQLKSTGDSQLFPLNLNLHCIKATNTRGCFDVPIAEWTISMMVSLAGNLRRRSAIRKPAFGIDRRSFSERYAG